MKLDEEKRENFIQLLALLVTLIIFLTFATSFALARVWQLQQRIELQMKETSL